MKPTSFLAVCVAFVLSLCANLRGAGASDADSPANDLAERGKISLTINHAKQIVTSCKLWADNHGGKYPDRLTDLLIEGYLGKGNWKVLQSPLSEGEKYGFYYYGFKFSPDDAGNLVVVSSHWRGADGKRVIGHNDGSAVLEIPKTADYPGAESAAGQPSKAGGPSAPVGPSSLSADAMRSLVIVAGERALGSGFTARLGGKTYVVTNSHVIRGQSQLSFTNMSNQAMQTGALQIADSADLVRAEVTGVSAVLEVEEKVEAQVKIGDAVVVAGNSEGAGVVREIPGKVVGIGPDRIEVDAPFVSGNSGSPILLKATGRVIGVATYVKIPPPVRGNEKSATKLNEVRRFGYRLDTVSNWVTPPQPLHLLREGEKLNEISEVESLVRALYLGGPDTAVKLGPDILFGKRQMEIPALATLHSALADYCSHYPSATAPDEKKKQVEAVIHAMGVALGSEITGLQPEHFSGYFSILFRTEEAQVKEIQELFANGSAVSAWLTTPTVAANNPPMSKAAAKRAARKAAETPAPAVSPGGDVSFTLTAYANPKIKRPERRYSVSFPPKQMPADRSGYFWGIDSPSHILQTLPLDSDDWHLGAVTEHGTYKISIEHHFSQQEKHVVSNVAELTVP